MLRESTPVTVGEHQLDLGPCAHIIYVDKILNLRKARHVMLDEGQATVRMRMAQDLQPPMRYSGTELPSA